MFKPHFPGSFILAVIVLAVTLIQAVAFSFLLWRDFQAHSEQYSEILERTSLERSRLLAAALVPHIKSYSSKALLDILQLLNANANWRYASVFDARRLPLASLGEPAPLTQPLTQDFFFRYRVSDDLIEIEQPIVSDGKNIGILLMGYATSEAQTALAEIMLRNAIIALLGWILSTLLLIAMTLSVRRGLGRLQTAVNALRQNRWEHRLSSGSLDPVGSIAADVNALAAQLQVTHAELRGQYEQQLQESRRLNTLLHGIDAVVWEVDPGEGRFTYVSSEAERLLGYPVEAWLQADFLKEHIHADDLGWIQDFLCHPPASAEHASMDFRIRDSTGEYLWLRLISTVETRARGSVLAGILLNVTEEKHSEQHIVYLANHDSLTGLINRGHFQQKLEDAIDDSRRTRSGGALLFLDLDQFKYINDTSGHQAGDEYLRQVANHICDILGNSVTIGRLGGDEFGIILDNTDIEQATRVSDDLLKKLHTREFDYQGQRALFSASIGIALFPEHGDRASDLLAKADSAMYNAKDQGRNNYRIFEISTDVAHMEDKIYWEERIRHAIKEDRFRLYFQPIVDIETGVIHHYESLLRMLGDGGEIVTPGIFIDVAERFGMIREIDHWVVTNAIRTQGRSALIGKSVSLTINLSGRHFGGDDILEVIEKATRDSGAEPNNIIFEVTETAAVKNFNQARGFIKALHKGGYRFALDDFGAGFSSFDYLKHIPVDYIKIDGSFVRNLHREKNDRIFVSAIADMARSLKVQTVAEFVENRQTLEILKELKVPLGQGYFFAQPAPRFHEHRRVLVPSG